MSNRSRKADVLKILERRDFDALRKWAEEVRNPFRVLMSLAYEAEGILWWRTMEATGIVAAVQATIDIERVRDFVRRLLWLMNDESGGLARFAPEMIGEILVNVPAFIDDTAEILPSFLKEEPFERGTHLAIYRVASVNTGPFLKSIPKIVKSLDDSDPYIKSYTAMILGVLGDSRFCEGIKTLAGDRTSVVVYDFDSGNLDETTVANIADMVLKQIESSGQAA